MVRIESLSPSSTIFEGKKDEKEASFENILKNAYENFPKLKVHADLHPSEYEHVANLINGLPTQLQNKWKLLRLCLWNKYGSSIFGEIFNLTPDKTRMETALLSDLPDELTNMVSELLEADDDDYEDEEEIENITSKFSSKRYNIRANPEKRDYVSLAEGGQKWETLTDNQRLVLKERYLADRPESRNALARRLGISIQRIIQTEKQGLRKLGFFGDAINLTRQQLQIIFQNAIEDDINSLAPRQLELLNRLYGVDVKSQPSQPTIHSVAEDLKINESVVNKRHQNAMQKLIHTESAIHIVRMSLQPTSEQVNLMRQQIPLQGVRKVAEEMEISPNIVRRWQKQEGIPTSKPRTPTLRSGHWAFRFAEIIHSSLTLRSGHSGCGVKGDNKK